MCMPLVMIMKKGFGKKFQNSFYSYLVSLSIIFTLIPNISFYSYMTFYSLFRFKLTVIILYFNAETWMIHQLLHQAGRVLSLPKKGVDVQHEC
jgi:hypothetical protein